MNPEPVTVYELPTGPCNGATAMAGTVTEYDPDALTKWVSIANTVVPEVPLGTANEHEKSPERSVLSEPAAGHVETPTLSKVRVIVSEAVNAVPDTVTGLPCGPCVGFTIIAVPNGWIFAGVGPVTVVVDVPTGATIENGVVAVFLGCEVSFAVIV